MVNSHLTFDRASWSRLRSTVSLTLNENDILSLCSLNDRISIEEVIDIYLPLSRLLNLHVMASQGLHQVTHTFLGTTVTRPPYVIGLAGSVAVGKSTTARILRKLLTYWPEHPQVDLITTDGFLYPNRVLEEREIVNRKGFPESYDIRKLIQFMIDVKSGCEEVCAPVYSHLAYDILPDQIQRIRSPDILIVEGLNVLQTDHKIGKLFLSDFFDFSIYIDADEEHIERWYIERFLALRERVFVDPSSYFHRYAHLSETEARELALSIWRRVNLPNLHTNILPTRDRARLQLKKGRNHFVEQVKLRKV